MPEIKIQHVVSCSSEDKNNPAENLLKTDGTHKWRSATSGVKQLTAVLQFEKSSPIQTIDIGNDGSGFVEILVGKSTAANDQDYQVILVASTFMSPMESRNGTNRTAVRMFGPDKLSKAVSGQNWDRVKIVCTQPFNKNTAYGLSFIRFNSPSDGKDEPQKPMMKLGAFTIKSEDDDNIKAGALFAGWGKEKTDAATPMKAAAAIRAASKLVEETKSPSSLERKAAVTPSTSSSTVTTPKPVKTTKPSPATKRKHDEEDDEKPISKTPLRKQSTSLTSVSSSKSSDDRPQPLKKFKSEPAKKNPEKEFSHLMERVIFVMSGYQNPYRAELRDKAVEMGATYKPDWGRSCTHLICAFSNTPKYNQVKGKGKIVNKNFITDCYKQKKLLNWRKYRVGDADSPSSSSEEEEEVPVVKHVKKTSKKARSPSPPLTDNDELYGGETESPQDTDEEIERIQATINAKKLMEEKAAQQEESGSTPNKTKQPIKTESIDDDSSDSGLPELPDFFSDKKFFLYGKFGDAEKRLMNRYITAYNGELSDYMSNDVTYVLTNSKWDDNFDDALSDNNKLIFVKPKWVNLCHEKLKCLPHQPYVVVPSS